MRTFFCAVTGQALEAGVRDVGELYRLLVAADASELRALVEGTPAQPFLDQHNSRMFDSIPWVASDAVLALQYVAPQNAKPLSGRRWVNTDQPGVLFIPYKAGQIAALRGSISAWMRLAIFETMNRDDGAAFTAAPRDANRRLWFVVDELDALGQIDGLKDALARLQKFDGRCVFGIQSIAQVSSTYGHGDAHTIVENCGSSLLLRCSASEGGGTARFASQLVGDREVMRTTTRRAAGSASGSARKPTASTSPSRRHCCRRNLNNYPTLPDPEIRVRPYLAARRVVAGCNPEPERECHCRRECQRRLSAARTEPVPRQTLGGPGPTARPGGGTGWGRG